LSFNKNFLNKNPLVNNGVSSNGPVKPSINEWVNSSNASNVSQDGVFYGVKPNVKTKSSMKPLVANKENPVINKDGIPIKPYKYPQGGGIAAGLGDIAQADPAVAGVVGSVIPGVSETQDTIDMFTSLKKGDYLGAGISGIGLITPFVGGRAIKGLLGTAGSRLSKTGRAEAKLLKDPNFVRVYTADGSSKIMDKSKAIHLNRIEDANITNKVYDKPGVEYEDYNWANRTKGEGQAVATKHYLDNTKRLGGNEKNFSTYNLGEDEKRRLISMYFDPKDIENFSVFNSTNRAYEMSKNKANEFVIAPDIMKDIRNKKSGPGFTTTIGSKSDILKQMTKFWQED